MNEMIPITAAVLAAGASSRMARCKQLLPIKGTPMLALTLRKLLSLPFESVICITGYWQREIEAGIHIEDPRFEWIYNPNHADGQSASLRIAGKRCPESMLGILIFLSDQPFITSGTIECVLKEAQKPAVPNLKRVIQPIFRERKGHPVFFSRSMLVHFPELKGDAGAKTIMKHADEHILVPVEDEGTVLDLDTMEQYDKYR